MDRVADHAAAVQVEVETHGPEPRIEDLTEVRVEGLCPEGTLPRVGIRYVEGPDERALVRLRQDGVLVHENREVVPVLAPGVGDETDIGDVVAGG